MTDLATTALPLADITGPLVTFATDFVNSAGYAGIFVLMLLESACIPIPSEATVLVGGVAVSKRDLALLGVSTAGARPLARRVGVRASRPPDTHEPRRRPSRRIVA